MNVKNWTLLFTRFSFIIVQLISSCRFNIIDIEGPRDDDFVQYFEYFEVFPKAWTAIFSV